MNVLGHVLRAFFFFLRKNKLLFDNNPKNVNVYDFPIMKCDFKLEKKLFLVTNNIKQISVSLA